MTLAWKIGQQFADRRRELGVSQAQIAYEFGRTSTWISVRECGREGAATFRLYEAIAYGAILNQLERGKPKPTSRRIADRSVMRATIMIEADESSYRAWLDDIYSGPPDDPAPDPFEAFAEQMQGLVDDELAVALMFNPATRVELGEVTR